MHELSIVEALIDQVGQELERAGQRGRVLRLELSIGRLSGVHLRVRPFRLRPAPPGTPRRKCRNRHPGTESRLQLPRLQRPD